MAKQRNQWSPDTCGCVLVYEWDDSEPLETRVHTHCETVKKCDLHTHLEGEKHYNIVTNENKMKNIFHSVLMEQLPEILEADGSLVKEKYRYDDVLQPDGSRQFLYDVSDLTDIQKTKLRALTVSTREGVVPLMSQMRLN